MASAVPEMKKIKEFELGHGRLKSIQNLGDASNISIAANDTVVVYDTSTWDRVEKVSAPDTWLTSAIQDKKGRILIPDNKQSNIYVQKNMDSPLEKWGNGKCIWNNPWGILQLPGDKIAIADHGRADDAIPVANILSSEGELLDTILIKKRGASCYSPMFMVRNTHHNGDIAVTNQEGGFFIFSAEWDFMKAVADQRSEEGQPKIVKAWDICLDAQGNYLVVDSKINNVSMFSADGNFMGILLSEENGLEKPRGVCLTKEGHIVIGENNGDIKVYQYV